MKIIKKENSENRRGGKRERERERVLLLSFPLSPFLLIFNFLFKISFLKVKIDKVEIVEVYSILSLFFLLFLIFCFNNEELFLFLL